jgi:hypothetical protein
MTKFFKTQTRIIDIQILNDKGEIAYSNKEKVSIFAESSSP